MTIQQIIYMSEIAECKSMSRAAEKLLVSQPALSLQIRSLEEEVGCPLFHRTTKGVYLTAAGELFYERAREVTESWNRLQLGIRDLKKAVCRKVRIGFGARAMSNGLFEAVLHFFEDHPETELSFYTDLGDNPLEALVQNKLELVIDRMPLESMIRSREQFAVTELLRERQCILFAVNDPRACRAEIPFEELDGESVVCGPEESWDDEIMKQSCEIYGVRLKKVYRADSIDAAMAMVKKGKGAALGPASFSGKYGVAAVPMVPETEIALNLICLEQDRKNPLVLQLKQFLLNYTANRGTRNCLW